MAYEIFYSPDVARKDLPHIAPAIRHRIQTAIEAKLIHDPLWAGKPLRQSLAGYRKMRVGDYRIIFRIAGDTIVILKIGHRREVYKQMFG